MDHAVRLLPCFHSDSAFLKMIKEGKLSQEKAKYYYFEISGLILEGKNNLVKYTGNSLVPAKTDEHSNSVTLSDAEMKKVSNSETQADETNIKKTRERKA